jgi:coproporphyrinogen III oxidase-like Fe-S oxidoreductase
MNGSAEAPFGVRICPFCGVSTAVPHETQQGCIDALHVEIARMRGILDHLRPLRSLNSEPEDHRA